MQLFYYANHVLHDPSSLHHPHLLRQNKDYAETAQRGLLIHEALQAAKLGHISAPGDFGPEPIQDVHEWSLLQTLENAYRRMLEEEGITPALPDSFSVHGKPKHKPRAMRGLLGYHSLDIYAPIFEHTWQSAYWSAQTALSAVAMLHKGEQATYALCRPPGHHATTSLMGGFCYLNNAAVAANWLTQQGQRVAILDVDFHHGNGTQEIFYGRYDVLYCSLHADPLTDYPYYWGFADEFGSGSGQNYNYNFPLSRGCDETTYLEALNKALKKIRLYHPDTLIISLGVDTCMDDPVGGFNLTTESFTKMAEVIQQLNLPTAVIQEGGYRLDLLGENVVAFLRPFA